MVAYLNRKIFLCKLICDGAVNKMIIPFISEPEKDRIMSRFLQKLHWKTFHIHFVVVTVGMK